MPPFKKNVGTVLDSGMTMRQYYKTAAINGLLASGYLERAESKTANGNIIILASSIADALIIEDEKSKKDI
jgi:hypothetical protein